MLDLTNASTGARTTGKRLWHALTRTIEATLWSCALVLIWAWLAGTIAIAEDVAGSSAAPRRLDSRFVGSQKCQSCHSEEHKEWTDSHHHAAMQPATDQTVLGNFNNATFFKDGIESTFFRRDGKYWVRTDGPDGKLAEFEISYTFGIAPLQQYLIALPGGRYQALGIVWDSRPKSEGGQRWYHLYPNRTLKAGEPLHWTGIDQNWNYQCAWCHSTNLQKNYSPQSKSFQTTWAEISVGCEACHGPASHHVDWASVAAGGSGAADPTKGFAVSLDERRSINWALGPNGQAKRSAPRTSSKEISVCAPCHARRGQFSSDPADFGHFFDAFRPSGLEAELYYSDGQQRDEVYKYGSFLQSRMYAAGVTCSDCHNPHTGKLKADGNAVCAQCHAPDRFDVASHHHHASGSEGAKCTSCHMPATTYMGVDARHDHSLRIPRPDQTVRLGTPNPCSTCHKDKSAAWARDAVKVWYPSPKRGQQIFAEAFDLADRGAPGAETALQKVAIDDTVNSIARASALARLTRFPSAEALAIAARSLEIEDAAVRAAAISIIAGANPETRRTLLVPLLRDETRLVRMDAARALAGDAEAGLTGDDRAAFEKALDEYVAGQLFDAERAEAHVNLGNLYRDQGRLDAARASLQTAIGLDPSFVVASISLAELERSESGEPNAEVLLRDALKANPSSGPVQHALGLSLIRQKRLEEALVYLEKAAVNAPEDPRNGYVLAVALHDTGKHDEAISALKNTIARHPYDRDALYALASYEIEGGNDAAALQHLELLNRLEPARTDIQQLIGRLRLKSRN